MTEAEKAFGAFMSSFASADDPHLIWMAAWQAATERAAEILENVAHPGVDCARVNQGAIDEIRQQREGAEPEK